MQLGLFAAAALVWAGLHTFGSLQLPLGVAIVACLAYAWAKGRLARKHKRTAMAAEARRVRMEEELRCGVSAKARALVCVVVWYVCV